ncbi:hypothetical protein F5972_14450 [Microbispora cellulosiformans]|uniref:Uncharacterized protein n=1 Tax=Microbispora cellulosiformans TaxID=2614688 RepID=A0A5J5K3X6_9ACTN|nr:hypothetical protein [Microbispora cellulosiformans]KAA9378105.1 hypothetical protein F5972_14450 [Microbispora cellulosiformans]
MDHRAQDRAHGDTYGRAHGRAQDPACDRARGRAQDSARDRDLRRLVAGIAPGPGPGLTPLAMELLEEIVSGPAPARGHRDRLRHMARGAVRNVQLRLAAVVLPLAAVLLAVSWLVPGAAGLGPAPASAALDIRREGGHYVVMVRDLFADPATYQRELRQRGLDVEVRIVPTAPASAGRALYVDGTRDNSAITAIQAPGTCVRFAGCPTGFRIPVDFRGHAEVLIGRAARPGERYGLMEHIDMEGMPFHCVDFLNRTVGEVLPLLREHGVRAEFTSYTAHGARRPAPAGWYVLEGIMVADGQALLLVGPAPNPRPRARDAYCPAAAGPSSHP